jgi:hypothetical protein
VVLVETDLRVRLQAQALRELAEEEEEDLTQVVVLVVVVVVAQLVLLMQTDRLVIQIKVLGVAVETKHLLQVVIFQPLAEQVGQALSY